MSSNLSFILIHFRLAFCLRRSWLDYLRYCLSFARWRTSWARLCLLSCCLTSKLSFSCPFFRILSLLNFGLLWTYVNFQIPSFISFKTFSILLKDIFDSLLKALLKFSSILFLNVNGLHINMITYQAHIPALFAFFGIYDLMAVIVIAIPVIVRDRLKRERFLFDIWSHALFI